jgi:hypothetical protein
VSDEDPRIAKLTALVAKQAALLDQQAALLRAVTEALEQPATGPSAVTRALVTFDGHWTAKYGTRYHFTAGKDAAHAKRLIKAVGLEDLERRMRLYFESRDTFHATQKHPFSTFVSQVNRFGGKRPDVGTGRIVGRAGPTVGKYDFFDEDPNPPHVPGGPAARGDAGLPQPSDPRRGDGVPEVPAARPDTVDKPAARHPAKARGVDGVSHGRANRL